MTDPKMTMEVPAQVREFAEKSMDNAEKAFSSFMESASKSVAMVPGPMTDVAKQALAISETNLKSSFEHARKLLHAKDINEVMQLQFPRARNPSYKVGVDVGADRIMWSSAQMTNYQPDELVGSPVVCVCNLGSKNIAGFASELLILGAKDADGKVIALTPRSAIAVGQPIF